MLIADIDMQVGKTGKLLQTKYLVDRRRKNQVRKSKFQYNK